MLCSAIVGTCSLTLAEANTTQSNDWVLLYNTVTTINVSVQLILTESNGILQNMDRLIISQDVDLS